LLLEPASYLVQQFKLGHAVDPLESFPAVAVNAGAAAVMRGAQGDGVVVGCAATGADARADVVDLGGVVFLLSRCPTKQQF
jgi:hypothetical protein